MTSCSVFHNDVLSLFHDDGVMYNVSQLHSILYVRW